MVLYFLSLLIGVTFFQPLGGIFDRFDTLRLRWIANLRTDSLTDVMLFVNLLASRWTIRALRWGTIATLVGFRHWRHLFVYLGSILVVEIVAYQISTLLGRSRPQGITIIAPWEGYSMPSRPLVGLAASLVGITYASRSFSPACTSRWTIPPMPCSAPSWASPSPSWRSGGTRRTTRSR